jgi:hypothetical protein
MKEENPIDKKVNNFWNTLITSKVVLIILLIVSIFFVLLGILWMVFSFQNMSRGKEIFLWGMIIFLISFSLFVLSMIQLRRVNRK